MIFIKFVIYICILGTSSLIGIMLSKKFENRVLELKEFKNALNIFKTKIKFTYEPVPEIFSELGNILNSNISNIFKVASMNMQYQTADLAWNNSLKNETNLNLLKEDLDVLYNLGKLLGKTDVEGQISEIELVDSFLNMQIEKAEKEREKNSKLYKTLGMTLGLAIVIILL